MNELEILEKIEIIDEMLSILRQCKPWESDTVLMLSIIAAIQMTNKNEKQEERV